MVMLAVLHALSRRLGLAVIAVFSLRNVDPKTLREVAFRHQGKKYPLTSLKFRSYLAVLSYAAGLHGLFVATVLSPDETLAIACSRCPYHMHTMAEAWCMP